MTAVESPRPPLAEPVVTHHIASVVLGWQRAGGYTPSSGEDALIAAAFALDEGTAAACLNCPGLLEAVRVWRYEGAAALKRLADAA